MVEIMQKWIVEHDSHAEKAGDTFVGIELPVYLVGKVRFIGEVSEAEAKEFEVNTPNKKSKQKDEGNV